MRKAKKLVGPVKAKAKVRAKAKVKAPPKTKARKFVAPDLDEFSESLTKETDRACGVLGAALLDAALEDLVRENFGAMAAELVDQSRPLGSFGPRIQLAQALGWIDHDVAADLNNIRKIRNEFAHDVNHKLSFNDQGMPARCANLIAAKSWLDGVAEAALTSKNHDRSLFQSVIDKFSAPRWRFQLSVSFLFQVIRDLPRSPAQYRGPSVRKDVFDLGSRIYGGSVKIQGTVSPPRATS